MSDLQLTALPSTLWAMTSGVVYEVEDQIAILRVNRPQARNALDWAAQEAFAAAVTAVALDTAVRMLIITGTGPEAFVAGGDLKELSQHPESAAGERLNRVMGTALAQLSDLPIPVIAAVNGDAIGGGCEIVTACDLCLAAAHAHFSFAQVKVGLTTGWGGTARLVQLIGQRRAMELLLTSRLFDVEEAVQFGLVHRIVSPENDVLTAARRWAIQLVQLPRTALAETKSLVNQAGQARLREAYQLETERFVALWPQADHLEAMQAFIEKRKPIFNRG
jgi:enoyl-CoA hydratase